MTLSDFITGSNYKPWMNFVLAALWATACWRAYSVGAEPTAILMAALCGYRVRALTHHTADTEGNQK